MYLAGVLASHGRRRRFKFSLPNQRSQRRGPEHRGLSSFLMVLVFTEDPLCSNMTETAPARSTPPLREAYLKAVAIRGLTDFSFPWTPNGHHVVEMHLLTGFFITRHRQPFKHYFLHVIDRTPSLWSSSHLNLKETLIL